MILKRYISRELLGGFAIALGGLTALLVAMQTYAALRSLPEVGAALFFELLIPMLTSVLPFTLLVSVILGTTLCYGRLSGDHELDAMRVAGMPLRTILLPAVFLGLLVSALSFWLHWTAVPSALRKQRRVSDEAVVQVLKKPPPGPREVGIGKLRFSYRSVEGGTFLDVHLFEKEGEARQELTAPRARVEFREGKVPLLHLEEARIVRFDSKGPRAEEVTGDVAKPLPLGKEKKSKLRPMYAAGNELPYYQDNPIERRTARMEMHMRIARSISPLLLGVLAALIGLHVKRSSRLAGLGASLPPLLLYFIITVPLEGLGERGTLPASMAAYLPIGILGGIDGWLYWRGSR